MTQVFGDAGYYIALLVRRDRLHARAIEVSQLIADVRQVTTEAVVIEVFDHMSGLGPDARAAAVDFLGRLKRRATIVPLSSELINAGISLYRARPDKGYSLTDAISMVVCKAEGITEVLSNDHHFEQERLRTLL